MVGTSRCFRKPLSTWAGVAMVTFLAADRVVPVRAVAAGPAADRRWVTRALAALPKGAVARLGSPVFRCRSGVIAVAFSRDGRRLAAIEKTGRVSIWETASGAEVALPPLGHEKPTAVGISPDGELVVTTGQSARFPTRVRMWRMSDGKMFRQLMPLVRQRPARLAFFPDGELLASTGRPVRVWEFKTGRLRLSCDVKGHKDLGVAFGLSISPKGRYLAVANVDGVIRLWDVEARRLVTRIAPRVHGPAGGGGKKKAEPRKAFSVAFSPDGKTLAYGCPERRVGLWDVQGNRLTRTLTLADGSEPPKPSTHYAVPAVRSRVLTEAPREAVLRLIWADQGRTLVAYTAPDGLTLWDVASEKLKARLDFHPKDSLKAYLAMSPDGRTLAACSEERHSVLLYDVRQGRRLFDRPFHACGVWHVRYSPDGTVMATADSTGDVLLWDADGRFLRRLKGRPSCSLGTMRFSPDGSALFVGDDEGDIRKWDPATGKCLLTVRIPRRFKDIARYASALAVSPDGKRLFAGTRDPVATMFDVERGKVLWQAKLPGGYLSLAVFAADGKSVAYKESFSRLCVLDLATRKVVRKMDSDDMRDLQSIDGGKVLITGRGRGLDFWDAMTGKKVRTLKLDPPGLMGMGGSGASKDWCFFRVSPDETLLAVTGRKGPIRLCEIVTGKCVLTLKGDGVAVYPMDFSPDGSRLIAGSEGGWSILWSLDPWAQPGAAKPPTDPAALWKALGAEDAAAAYRAEWALVRLGAKGKAFLTRKLAGPKAGVAEIRRLVGQLGADEYAVREEASRRLKAMGRAAEPTLRKLLPDIEDLEALARIGRILAALAEGKTSAGALQNARARRALWRLEAPRRGSGSKP